MPRGVDPRGMALLWLDVPAIRAAAYAILKAW
jgi:hypothetical protein